MIKVDFLSILPKNLVLSSISFLLVHCSQIVLQANSQVTRMDIFWSLVHLLKQTTATGNDTTDQPSDAINGGVPQLDSCQKPSLPPPISMAETLG